jgi:hypothetical protein
MRMYTYIHLGSIYLCANISRTCALGPGWADETTRVLVLRGDRGRARIRDPPPPPPPQAVVIHIVVGPVRTSYSYIPAEADVIQRTKMGAASIRRVRTGTIYWRQVW